MPSPTDVPLTLSTLGGARLSRANQTLLGPGKSLALITYLALAPGHSASREFLLDLLWSDLDHDRARHALRQTVWQLRQLLGDACFTGREELTLGLNLDADRDRFLAAIEAGDPDRAIALYTGIFLPDFALPGSTEFEHWAETERSRLRATFLRAAEMVARRRLAAGRFRDAQELARRIRDADRLNETGWRLLLKALIAGRDLIQAAVEADALTATLSAERREPEPATKQALAELRSAQGEIADHANVTTSALLAELVGREHEFALVLDAWAGASKGPARHVHISAPAGLGKTRLLGDVAHRLRSLGARVLQLRANPGDRGVAYAFAGDLAQRLGPMPGLPGVSPATADALVGLSLSLSGRFPNARPVRYLPELLRIRTAALAEALTEIAADHPVALLIDDTHWLDAESRQMLEGILHRLDRAPVLVVSAGRPGAGRSLEVAGTASVELGPLDRSAVAALFLSLGRLPDSSLAETIAHRLYRTTGGSPLLTLEALQLALERRTLTLADGIWEVLDARALLAELNQGHALSARLDALDPQAAWVLLLLATAGTPLTLTEMRSGMRAPDTLDELIWVLEQKGLVHRAGPSWEVAHDEIITAALNGETAERRKAAHAGVGRILLNNPAARPEAAVEACRHFAEAGDDAGLRLAFRRTVAAARRAGDPRTLQALAIDALGAPAPMDAARRLVRALPLSTRTGLDSPRRLGAVATVAIAIGLFGANRLMPAPIDAPDASLLLFRPSATDMSVVEVGTVAIRRSGWRGGTRIPAPSWTAIRDPHLARAGALVVSPDGKRWAFNAPTDNILTDEIFMRSNDRTALLTGGPRDDSGPEWSPDGSRVAFMTARWSAPGADDYDLGSLELKTGAIRRLTASADFDRSPAWSPTGALIAFVRGYRELRPTGLCWVTLDTRAEHCVEFPELEPAAVVGWLDNRRVLFTTSGTDDRGLFRWDVITDRVEPLLAGGVRNAVLSPDARWVACLCSGPTAGRESWTAFPVDDPGAARVIDVDETRIVAWQSGRRHAGSIAAIRIERRHIAVPVGGRHQLAAMVTDGGGDPVPVPTAALRWSTADPTVARVDSASARLVGGRLGRTMLRVDLAGLVLDSVVVVVMPDASTALLDERWNSIDTTRWLPFGAPRPHLDSGPGGIAGLNNGGDGSYSSGVISGGSHDVSNGLGFEAKVSLPVNRSQWQAATLSLTSSRGWPLAGWDRTTGTVSTTIHAGETCGAAYPAGEGVAGAGRIALYGGVEPSYVSADSTWRLGAWHRLRVQVFPDGACGIAVDGIAVWRSQTRVPVDQPYRVLINGNSAGTKMLVGPLQVWLGVRKDVDWSVVDRNPVSNRP